MSDSMSGGARPNFETDVMGQQQCRVSGGASVNSASLREEIVMFKSKLTRRRMIGRAVAGAKADSAHIEA
jgi:hypothetical protein